MGFINEWKQSAKLLRQKQRIVFFAESAHYFVYFSHLVNALTEHGATVIYITADPKDPLLKQQQPGLQVYCFRYLLISVLNRLKAQYVFMTMTELGHHAFQKSKAVDKYVYVFHALVSMHRQYRKDAFKAYDVFLSPGVSFDAEIKNAVPSAKLLSYGYPMLSDMAGTDSSNTSSIQKILLAPSWHEGCIFNTCFEDLVAALIGNNIHVTIRFHPEYKKRYYRRWVQIQSYIKSHSFLKMDSEPDVMKSIRLHQVLITDRSGIAFEFALGKSFPVIYINTEKKVMNKDKTQLYEPVFEDMYREHTGISVAPSRIHELPEVLKQMTINQTLWQHQLQQLKQELVYDEKAMLPKVTAAFLNNEV